MRFYDYVPPASPSLDQQRDALRKGLGRATQWAMGRRLEEAPLLAACLQDQRYDQQVENSRGDWLWRMIQAVDAADRFRASPILRALHELPDERAPASSASFARGYAESGAEAFRTRLYEIVEQTPFADRAWLGEEEIIDLDGDKGFLFAAQARAERLPRREWEWDDEALINRAVERIGDARAVELLDDAKNPPLRAYWERWRREKQAKAAREPHISHRERMQAIGVEEILSTAESSVSRFGLYRGWGMYAEDSELDAIHQHLSTAREPRVLANLLFVFSNRADPRFVPRFIELCRHEDSEVRRRAVLALEGIKHPHIREFALSELSEASRGSSVVGLFGENYRPGDERRILDAIDLPDEDEKQHGLLMDVIRVLEKNRDADCSQLGVVAYASTPCEHCRADSVRLLLDRHVAPAWLVEECRFDSGEKCRDLVAEIAGPRQPEPE